MLAVQRDGGRIGCAHLQRQECEIERRRPRAQRVEQRVRDALPPALRRNGDIADVALVEHVQKVCVAEHRLPRSRDEKHVPVVRQLAGQLRARPRRGKARALERGELRQVRRPGVADRVVHQCASAQLVPIFASTSSGTR